MDSKINHLEESCLCLLCGGKKCFLGNLLDKDKFVLIHTRNLQTLAMEIFKIYENIFSILFDEIFPRHDSLQCQT